jgi:hypothetical protein
MFKRMQGFIIGFMTCAILFGGVAFAAEYVIKENSFPIFVSGTQNDNIKALNIDDFTWIQLGSLKEVGLVVKFNQPDKRIEITNEAQTLAPVGEVNTVGETTTQIQYDAVTGLPIGATYIDFNGCQAVSFNSKTYLSESDLKAKYYLVYQGGYNGSGVFVNKKDNSKISVDSLSQNSFIANGTVYIDISIFGGVI